MNRRIRKLRRLAKEVYALAVEEPGPLARAKLVTAGDTLTLHAANLEAIEKRTTLS